MEPARDYAGVGGVGKVMGGERIGGENGAAAGVGLGRVKGGVEGVGIEVCLQKCEGFVAIVVGFLEEEEVRVVEELAEMLKFPAELCGVDRGERPGVPGAD